MGHYPTDLLTFHPFEWSASLSMHNFHNICMKYRCWKYFFYFSLVSNPSIIIYHLQPIFVGKIKGDKENPEFLVFLHFVYSGNFCKNYFFEALLNWTEASFDIFYICLSEYTSCLILFIYLDETFLKSNLFSF